MNKFSKIATVGLLSFSLIAPSHAVNMSVENRNKVAHAVAGGIAWSAMGTANMLLRAYSQFQFDSSGNWGGAMATVCGGLAAGGFKNWDPPHDSYAPSPLLFSALKSISVVGTSSVCGWVTAWGVEIGKRRHAQAKLNEDKAHKDLATRNAVAVVDLKYTNAENALNVSMSKAWAYYHDYLKMKNGYLNAGCEKKPKNNPNAYCSVLVQNFTNAYYTYENQIKVTKQKAWDLGQRIYEADKYAKMGLPKPTAPRP